MQVQQRIYDKLVSAFCPDVIELINESDKHSVPRYSETHFALTMVSDKFVNVRQVQRHQQVYAVLAHDMQNPIHALALHLYTNAEWEAAKQQVPASPDCLGGSKKEGKFQ